MIRSAKLKMKRFKSLLRLVYGRVAQLVEHGTENPGVAGSIPAPTTMGVWWNR